MSKAASTVSKKVDRNGIKAGETSSLHARSSSISSQARGRIDDATGQKSRSSPMKGSDVFETPKDSLAGKDKECWNPNAHASSSTLRVGVHPLKEGALEIGDDGRAIVWLDIDNTLYKKSTRIAELMTKRIKAYFRGLGLSEEETQRLHKRYYKEYGLAIRGLVMHHEIDALDYDEKCDASLPLDEILRPDEKVKKMLQDLDLTKCRIWALTNAYKTHALRCLRLLELDQYVEGIIYCDYALHNFACKPEREFYDGALQIVGMKDTSRCYFVDDSALNIRAAKKLGWGHCVLYDEEEEESASTETQVPNGLDKFDTSALTSKASTSGFDEEKVKAQIRMLDAPSRRKLLDIVLDACLPGDIAGMQNVLKKRLSLSRDIISSLPDDLHLKIFERLHIHELLRCRLVSKRWSAISVHPDLWRSYALVLTMGDSIPLTPPTDPTGWEPMVKGLYFRERNWAKGICQSITLMPGHTGFVTAMKLKGRTTLVTGSYDETIRVWDLRTGACKKVLKAKAIACLDFLAEEGILAAGLYDTGRVMIWDMRTWTLLQTLSGHNRGIRNVALNSDYLVSVGQDKAIVVWDWRNGTKIVRFGQQSNVSLGVSIVDHDKIVAVTVDGIIRTFDLSSPKKEMIGQFDVSKLAPNLSSRLSGLKDGSNMMQWFAAHRNTITMGSHNTVIHLQWQEHIVPIKRRTRARRDSNASTISTTSTVASSLNRRSSLALTNSVSVTPRRSVGAGLNTPVKSTTPSSHTRTQSLRNSLPASPRSPTSSIIKRNSIVGLGDLTAMSPRARTPTASSAMKANTPLKPVRTASRLSNAGSAGPNSPTVSPTNSTFATPPRLTSQRMKAHLEEMPDESYDSTPETGTRIAPNLSVAPLVLSVIDTPEGAVGCVDAAKRRIVCASRFSTRAGADRRLYTTTFEEHRIALPTQKVPNGLTVAAEDAEQNQEKVNGEASQTSQQTIEQPQGVVPIGGEWQSMKDQLATPSRNPMSLVLDPDHCVVGTSEGLVYCMNFVGSTHSKGWIDENGKDGGEIHQNGLQAADNDNTEKIGDAVIKELTELRQVWSSIFKKA
ncbi:uncharacterized protein FA14DRAFT_161015 [Meira miltonrushii]|uniref:F-box domain-containing protein n=1 Tax=Meira miltonrushii TaxID=1280837 RepID=A0A316VJH9_9BASI|nr:uncharacterized protein FA14DRAFT_161015 [Meira miltonrushii]PWN36181.1 hypothetical protein FA14DRAFT_161015 [Meira miltonrushii]